MPLIYEILRMICHQKWIRFGIRDRILRLFVDSDLAPNLPFSVPFFHYVYEGNLSSFIDWSTYFYGAYSYRELDFIKDVLLMNSDGFFIDVGANVGNHSLFAAAYCNKVLSFEPVPNLYEAIIQKKNTNKITNIHPFNYALGESDSVQSFLTSISSNQGTGKILNNPSETDNVIAVNVKKADNFLSDKGISNIALIKIDVEGYEPLVLKGMANTLAKYRPLVFFEWTETSKDLTNGQPTLMLFPPSYEIYVFDGHVSHLVFFERSRYRLQSAHSDLSEGNYVAIPKEAFGDGRTKLLSINTK